MILVGLTGGIGSGKSTVSALLAGKGAVVVDADAITRELQQPGQPVLAAIVSRFGTDVLGADGSLDRARLAGIVFTDPAALKELNDIVHPAVGAEIARRVEAERPTDHVVVLDIPLLVEGGRYRAAGLLVVDTPVDVAVARLVEYRGMDEADVRARIGRQATREQRLAVADRVIDNSGDPVSLAAQVDEAWAWMRSLPPEPATAPEVGRQ
jgi:dephospho-CoA kinase